MAKSDIPPLNWLRAFEASSRHLSFTGAAQELGLTQSAISQQIKGLEGYLETPLFYRKTRVLELTEVGRSYLPTVQEAFATLSSGTRTLLGPDREQVLQVQSNLGFSTFWLAPRLPQLFERHPWLKLNIFTAIWGPDKTAATADVEIRLGITPGEDVNAIKLAQETFFPVCAPELSISEDEIIDNYLYDCRGLTSTWDNWLLSKGERLPTDKNVTYASTYAVSISAALAGSGLAMAHDSLVSQLLETGKLKRVSDHAPEMAESYFLIAPERTKSSEAQRVFSDWILEEFSRA